MTATAATGTHRPRNGDVAETALLADIGGTNARFALAEGPRIGPVRRFRVADFADPSDAIEAFIKSSAARHRPSIAACAVAAPIAGEEAKLTNSDWVISAPRLRARHGLRRVELINDFAALAWAVPALGPDQLYDLGGGSGDRTAPSVVIGPGTGLGTAVYLPDGGRPRVLAGEGGHATMAPHDDWESTILARLRARFGHVSAERVLSGPGLENLYHTIAELQGAAAPALEASEITAQAIAGGSPVSRAALESFCAMLGSFAGNVALTVGGRAGVYIAGGIAPHIADQLAASPFRSRFEDKGRFNLYLSEIPAKIVMHPDPAFLGLAEFLRQQDRGV